MTGSVSDVNYLEGANPYPAALIAEYTAKGWWLNQTYGDVLDRSADRYPGKPAVIDDYVQLTYDELHQSVNRFASALLELGIGRFDRVLVQLPNRVEFLVAYFALHRIGAVPVLLTPRHEEREVVHVCRLATPVAWIVAQSYGSRDLGPLIREVGRQVDSLRTVIVVGEGATRPRDALLMADLIAGAQPEKATADYLRRYRPDPNDVAVLLPTGGTTGLPKAVPRTHNSILTSIRHAAEELRPGDVVGLATPVGHAMAQQSGVGATILTGATLVLIGVPRAGEIMAAVQRHRITSIRLVPTQLMDILGHPEVGSFDLSSLRQLGTAGAALPSELATRAQELFGEIGANFAGSGFGSSEGPAARHGPAEPPEVFHSSVGRPMSPGDRWKVIDELERELPKNTEGELAAKGPSVFTGYYQSPLENREIFTQDGFYKMGDLGRIDREGFIYVTGRKKDIIKRGGEGVIPAEIERLVHMHPSVEEAAVVAMPDERLGEKACAYVVLRPSRTLEFDELVRFMRGFGAGKLTLVEGLEIIDKLPRTPIGKVDKKALRLDIEERLRTRGAI